MRVKKQPTQVMSRLEQINGNVKNVANYSQPLSNLDSINWNIIPTSTFRL